jgi:biotin synthase
MSSALDIADRALLHERRRLTRAEVDAVAALPLDQLPDLVALAHRVRLAWCGPEVELESLINAKSGACPEDCAFCSQSARYSTDADVYPFLDLDQILDAARATRTAGATQFCIVVAVRGPSERLLDKVIDAVDAVQRETGLEIACSLGLLEPAQAARLAAAGVKRYNHNLEAPRAVFPSICTTHTYDDRVATAHLAIDAGMELCCGGILGMGETLDQRIARCRSTSSCRRAHRWASSG